MTYPDHNVDKDAVWDAYHQENPIRVPCILGSNPRIFLLDPELNTEGITLQQAAEDPETHVRTSLKYQLYLRTELNHFSDQPVGLPARWNVGLTVYNVYEAAYFGAEIDYKEGQIPDTTVLFPGDEPAEEIFEIDITRPLENPFIRDRLEFWREMEKICRDMTFEGRPVSLTPWAAQGTDGPVTVACNLRGTDFLMDLVAEPEYADRLMNYIMQAAILRRQAFLDYWGEGRIQAGNGLADDSIVLLGMDMYRERILPVHQRFYETCPNPDAERTMHLCGDATHLFPLIAEEMDVTTFDTGFPVDHGALRRELGPEITIQGGPSVPLLRNGSSNEVFERTREILQSGIKEGCRFILREGNNLPPCCPKENLAAMYDACLEYGRYS